jgi:tripartite-type tricarboxylate transporter receptor subunit TctC
MFVTSKERTSLAPNIPTSAEVGLKDFNLSSWYGVWAPKDTPDAVVDKLAAGMAEVSKDKAFIDKTTSLGIVPTARGPKDFAAFIKTEIETNTALLKEANFKPE